MLRALFILLLATPLASGTCMDSAPHEQMAGEIFSEENSRGLAQAACSGDLDQINAITQRAPDAANTVGRFGVTPLIFALTCEGLDFPDLVAEAFIETGQVRETVLPEDEMLKVLEALLAAGADPNLAVRGDYGPIYPGGDGYWIDGYSSVLIASEFYGTDVLRLLLKHGGDANARDTSKDHTALTLALGRGRSLDLGESMSPFDDRHWGNYFALLEAGAETNAPGQGGLNPIETASLTRPEIALKTLEGYPYKGEYDKILDFTIDAIEQGFPNSEPRQELLEFLKVEKSVDVDAAIADYKNYAKTTP